MTMLYVQYVENMENSITQSGILSRILLSNARQMSSSRSHTERTYSYSQFSI